MSVTGTLNTIARETNSARNGDTDMEFSSLGGGGDGEYTVQYSWGTSIFAKVDSFFFGTGPFDGVY